MLAGWIKLYRSIMDSDLWVRGGKFDRRSAWVYLLLQANHKDGRALMGNTFVPVARGSFITSEVELAKKWRWGRTAVRNLLALLEREEMVSIIRVPGKYTKIVVTNYDKYQDKNHTSNDTTQPPAQEPETDARRTAETQPTNRSRTGDEQVTNINKNEENEKKGKEDKDLRRRKPSAPAFSTDSPEMFLARRLRQRIVENLPTAKVPEGSTESLQRWCRDLDLILRVDKRNPSEVEALIDWCQRDSFWQSVILSPGNLRKKYDQLLLQRKRTDTPRPRAPTNTQRAMEAAQRLLAKEADRDDS